MASNIDHFNRYTIIQEAGVAVFVFKAELLTSIPMMALRNWSSRPPSSVSRGCPAASTSPRKLDSTDSVLGSSLWRVLIASGRMMVRKLMFRS